MRFMFWCDRQWRRLPFVDGHSGDVSITRVLALYFAWKIGQIINIKHEVTLNVLWLALAVLATAFGKSTFTFLLDRMRYRGEAAQLDARVETHQTTEIIDRRNLAQGMESTP